MKLIRSTLRRNESKFCEKLSKEISRNGYYRDIHDTITTSHFTKRSICSIIFQRIVQGMGRNQSYEADKI